MICSGCNKFPAFDTSTEPEFELQVEASLAKDDEGASQDGARDSDEAEAQITGTIRIVLTSECCGVECKEYTFDIDEQVTLERADGCTCDLTELEVEGDGSISERQETQKTVPIKRGPDKGKTKTVQIPYRYQRKYYGIDGSFTVSCACGKTKETQGINDEVPASGMDEI